MARAFATIAFTEGVKSTQARYGSRAANAGFELAQDARDEITEREAEFIAQRDSFYMATVSQSGWPYVQHRGGPPGFLKVLGPKHIGFADFRGNLQYLSVGNLQSNDRVSIILMDYPNRRRLKLWGRARIVHEDEDPGLVAKLEVSAYRARVERGIVIAIEACDWNCPQHITPRYTEHELEEVLAPLREENQALRARAAATPSRVQTLGDGPLELVVAGMRQLTPRIRGYELRHPAGKDLPPVEAGSHLRIPVRVDGVADTRSYSICSDPARRDAYEIAVLAEEQGRGGSKSVHELFHLGAHLRCEPPRNDFKLSGGQDAVVLVAGGIGITPIKAMAHALIARGTQFRLHYAGRAMREMAFALQLQQLLGHRLSCYAADRQQRLDLDGLVRQAPAHARFYVCGPQRLIDGVRAAASRCGVSTERIAFERFSAVTGAHDAAVEVELRKSGRTITVAPDQTVLAAVLDAGVDALADCGLGNCGTCAVRVLEGVPDHRDNALSPAERARGLMCICVSRAHSRQLALDL